MTIRPINLETDYPMICEWWKKHNFPVMPSQVFLPALGYIAEEGEAIAVSWLFIAPGTQGGIGLIEFTTTNPETLPKRVLLAVKALFSHLGDEAKAKGCGSVMSLVKQEGSEQHILDKSGWLNVGGSPHLIYGKPCH